MTAVCQVLPFHDLRPYVEIRTHQQNNADATVLVEVVLSNGDLRRGSGVVLHAPHLPCTYLLTCHHVLRTKTEAAVAVLKLEYRLLTDVPVLMRLQPDALFVSDPHLDYTLVAIAPHPHRPFAGVLPVCPLARKESEVEKPIYSLSHPLGAPLCMSQAGKRVAAAELDWKTKVAFTSEVHQGSSGGGVYDAQTGHLLALVTHETPHYNYGTNVKAIWRHAVRQPAVSAGAPQLHIALSDAVDAGDALDQGHYAGLIRQATVGVLWPPTPARGFHIMWNASLRGLAGIALMLPSVQYVSTVHMADVESADRCRRLLCRTY